MSLRAARRILRSAVPDAPADLGGDQVSPLEQMLRALPAEELRRLAEALHRSAWLQDRGRPAEALDAIGRAVELLREEAAA
jgi:hypothetical protein